jgi:hypothetical protein
MLTNLSEPEVRLLPMGVAFVFSLVGPMIYGHLLQKQANAELCSFLHGVSMFGILVGSISAGQYALDAYGEMSNEIFIAGMCFKNFAFYGLTWYVNNWIAGNGAQQMFFVVGGTSGFAVRSFRNAADLVFACHPHVYLREKVEKPLGEICTSNLLQC